MNRREDLFLYEELLLRGRISVDDTRKQMVNKESSPKKELKSMPPMIAGAVTASR